MRMTGDQEVAGLTPAGSVTFFCGDLILKYFPWSFSPFHQFLVCTILVNCLED